MGRFTGLLAHFLAAPCAPPPGWSLTNASVLWEEVPKESARRVVTSTEGVGSSSSPLLPLGASSPGKKSEGISPPSGGGNGDMLSTSEHKTPGPCHEGTADMASPRITMVANAARPTGAISLQKIKVQASVCPLGDVMGTCSPPQNRRPWVPHSRGTGDTASLGLGGWHWGRPPPQPRGQHPLKNQSGLILTKLLWEVGRGVERCAMKMAGELKHPPQNRAAWSKCAKSHQLPLGTNTPGVATRMLGPICTRLTGNLPQGRGYLPWRWQVHTHLHLEAVLPWVNVPNHITELPGATLSAPPSWTWGSQAAQPLVSTFPVKKSESPPGELMGTCCPGPSLNSPPLQTWGRLLLAPGAISPWKTKVEAGFCPLGEVMGHVPTSEPKTPGSLLKGNRRHSLPSTAVKEAATSAPGPRPLEKPKWSNLHETWWSTLEYCEWMARVRNF